MTIIIYLKKISYLKLQPKIHVAETYAALKNSKGGDYKTMMFSRVERLQKKTKGITQWFQQHRLCLTPNPTVERAVPVTCVLQEATKEAGGVLNTHFLTLIIESL